MRRAMLAGARDFLTKPPALDELNSAIHRAGQMAQEERAKVALQSSVVKSSGGNGANPSLVSYGKIICVYSPKGGTGCTTVAVNLAMTLHNEETPVALVDGNLQFGDVAVLLNEQSKNSVVDLAPRVEELDPEILEEVMVTHASSGVKILAAPSRPEYAENVNGDQFAKILQYLCRLYSYVVVDASSNLTDTVLATIDISDTIILLTTQDIPAIKNARLFLDLLEVLKINRNRLIFAMNRFDKRIGITPEKISESFKQEISAVIPVDERVVVPSINRGVPFMLGDRSRPIAKSFLSLAEIVRQRLSELANVEVVGSGQSGRKLGRR
jgi:pilus assembly protein CpaE